MKLSQFFLPTLKEDPSEVEIVSYRLMVRAGMIRQTSEEIYAWLPLGLRVLRKIEQIVWEEQNRAGEIELLMSVIQSADLWRETDPRPAISLRVILHVAVPTWEALTQLHRG